MKDRFTIYEELHQNSKTKFYNVIDKLNKSTPLVIKIRHDYFVYAMEVEAMKSISKVENENANWTTPQVFDCGIFSMVDEHDER